MRLKMLSDSSTSRPVPFERVRVRADRIRKYLKFLLLDYGLATLGQDRLAIPVLPSEDFSSRKSDVSAETRAPSGDIIFAPSLANRRVQVLAGRRTQISTLSRINAEGLALAIDELDTINWNSDRRYALFDYQMAEIIVGALRLVEAQFNSWATDEIPSAHEARAVEEVLANITNAL